MLVFILLFGVINALPVEIKPSNTDYFLPNNVVPNHYDISIDVTDLFSQITKEQTKFTGLVSINVDVNENEVEQIVLHSFQMEIDQFKIKVLLNEKDIFKSHKFDGKKDFLILSLKQAVNKGDKLQIKIPYTGTLQTDMSGFYISKYDGGKEIVLTTQFEPTNARKAFPCFDEPQYKATFNISIKKPVQYNVLSNMPVLNDRPTGVSFKKSPRMSTYLVAFVVHKFANKTSPINENYTVWAVPSYEKQLEYAANIVYDVVEVLNNFTGIRYDKYIPKMDMIALPDFSAGAMENWGLLTYRQSLLLVDEEKSTNSDVQNVATVIAHEVAHQWFGNLVTMLWWNNTWLNEGFARYFEYHTTDKVKPEWELKDQFVVEQQQSIFGLDALLETTPLTLEVYSPAEISKNFGSITYNKGGSVIRMMEHFLGSDVYQEGLHLYLHQNELKSSVPTKLWSALEEALSTKNQTLDYPIEKIMSPWISQPGYPVVHVKLDSNGYVTFSQNRFFLRPNENVEKEQSSWYVPISFTTLNELDFNNTKPKLWLTPHEPQKTVKLEDLESVVVNIQETGYYRVNYDEQSLNHLLAKLKEEPNKIHHLNRAQLVDDVLNLARAGETKYIFAFNVTDYLIKEDNYYPWYSAFRAFNYLLQRFSEDSKTGAGLRSYLNKTMQTLVEDKEFEVKNEEKQVEVLNKIQALNWACKLNNKKCVQNAQELFKKFQQNEKIPENLRSVIYCTSLRHGTDEDWDFLFEKYLDSDVPTEKIGILRALGCSSKETTLEKFLGYSLNSTVVRSQDAMSVLISVYSNSIKGVELSVKFLVENLEEVYINYRDGDVDRAVLDLANLITNEKLAEEFLEFLGNTTKLENVKVKAEETIKRNTEWTTKYYGIIGDIMEEKGRNGAITMIINKSILYLSLGFITIYLSMFN